VQYDQQVRDCTYTSRRTETTVLHSCSLLVRAQLHSNLTASTFPWLACKPVQRASLHPHPARPRSHLRPPASAPLSRCRSASPDAAPVPPTCAVPIVPAAVAVHTPVARRCAVRLLGRLLCTRDARFQLPQHLRRLMVTHPDAELERCDSSSSSVCIYLRAQLQKRLHRPPVPLLRREVKRCMFHSCPSSPRAPRVPPSEAAFAFMCMWELLSTAQRL
jgi:hypothetical protein